MKWLIIAALLLTSCYQRQTVDSHMQTMPYHNVGVRAGCVRGLARFVVDHQLYSIISVDEIFRRCDEVDRSFYQELKETEWRRT